jgi:hypothetical protein
VAGRLDRLADPMDAAEILGLLVTGLVTNRNASHREDRLAAACSVWPYDDTPHAARSR